MLGSSHSRAIRPAVRRVRSPTVPVTDSCMAPDAPADGGGVPDEVLLELLSVLAVPFFEMASWAKSA